MIKIRSILLLNFILLTFSYLEFSLIRIPHEKSLSNDPRIECLNDLPKKQSNDDQSQDEDTIEDDSIIEDSNNYKEICFEKDISYAVKFYKKDDDPFLISMDTTIPFSWLKGSNCHIGSTFKKCKRTEPTFESKVSEKIEQLWASKGHSKKKKKENEFALIKGSTEVVKGIMENTQNLTFETRDIGRLARMKDIFLIGLGVIDENHQIQLRQTNFISATRISPNLNYLCDGAASLRFDEKSQSSFLKEMMVAAQAGSREKYVTIYTGQNSSIMIGDISVKHSRQGFSGIVWIQTEEDKEYGRLPKVKSLTLSNSDTAIKTIDISIQAVFTISSSAIHIPGKYLQKILNKFFQKNKCEINSETRYVECNHFSDSDLDKQINFCFNETDVGIPLSSLVLKKSHKHVVLNIKKALDDRFIVLGEPIFQRYLIILDFIFNKIGITLQNEKPYKQIINVVSLLHFVIWTLIILCCIVLLSNPWEGLKKSLSEKPIVPYEYPYDPAYMRKKRYTPLDEEVNEEKRQESEVQ